MAYRGQSFAATSPGSGVEARRVRFERRAVSSRWLVADAVQRSHVEFVEGLEAYVDTDTGEVLASGWVRPPRPARCGWRLGGDVTVHADATTGTAHLSGTERCGSIWACPTCSAVIRAERAREIEQAVQAHQTAGGSVLFVTLTLRHRKGDPLAMLVDGLLGSWRKLLQGAAWKSTKGRYGIEGYIRSTEVTYGQSGWHPHLHALVLCKDELTDAQVQAFGDEVHGRWARYAMAATGRMPSRERGVDVQRVDGDGRVLAAYLGKIQEHEGNRVRRQGWGVGAELARGDVKTARAGGLVPFELLDQDHGEMPEGQRRRLWLEFYEATRGRRAITWSKGLKDALGVNERTDEEVIEDSERQGEVVAVIPGEVYDRLRRDEPGTLALLLDFAGRGRADVLAMLVPGVLTATRKAVAA